MNNESNDSQKYCKFVNIQNPDDYAFRSECTSTTTAENTVKVYNFQEDCITWIEVYSLM